MDSGMKRFTRAGTAVILLATVLIGATLVSAVFADTNAPEATQPASEVSVSPLDADVEPFFGVAAEAAAAALAVSADEVSGRLADGASLKTIADAQEVGYGTVARAVNDAVSAALDAAVREASISRQRADETRSAVAAWIDAGGQPEAGWVGDP